MQCSLLPTFCELKLLYIKTCRAADVLIHSFSALHQKLPVLSWTISNLTTPSSWALCFLSITASNMHSIWHAEPDIGISGLSWREGAIQISPPRLDRGSNYQREMRGLLLGGVQGRMKSRIMIACKYFLPFLSYLDVVCIDLVGCELACATTMFWSSPQKSLTYAWI